MNTRDRIIRSLSRPGAPIGMTDLAKGLQRPRSEVVGIIRSFGDVGATVAFDVKRQKVSGPPKNPLRHVLIRRGGAATAHQVIGRAIATPLEQRVGAPGGLGRRGWRDYLMARSAQVTAQRDRQREHGRKPV